MLPSARHEELGRLIVQDIQILCAAIVKLHGAVERMPSA
jgi:hypothetical protein